MKKYIFILPLFVFVGASYGCETNLDNAGLPYEEKLVIRGVLKESDVVDSLYVGHTLPYEEIPPYAYYYYYDTSKIKLDLASFVKDAEVTISNGSQTYFLQYWGNGYYKNDSLRGEEGKTYQLHVRWNDKIADAVTTIPLTPIFDSVTISEEIKETYEWGIETEFTSNSYVRAQVNDIMVLVVEVEESGIYMDTIPYTNAHPIGNAVLKKRIESNLSGDDILTSIFTIYKYTSQSSILDRKIRFTLTSYDEPYYRYYQTSGINYSDKSFSIEPRQIDWNVSGDAIGMFIGVSQSVVKTYQIQ